MSAYSFLFTVFLYLLAVLLYCCLSVCSTYKCRHAGDTIQLFHQSHQGQIAPGRMAYYDQSGGEIYFPCAKVSGWMDGQVFHPLFVIAFISKPPHITPLLLSLLFLFFLCPLYLPFFLLSISLCSSSPSSSSPSSPSISCRGLKCPVGSYETFLKYNMSNTKILWISETVFRSLELGPTLE